MKNHLLTINLLLSALAIADPGRTVDIRVVDETGKPIKGAQVLVHSGKENDVTSSGRRGFQEATDADGRWHHEFKPKWGLENIQVFLHEDQPEREVYPIKLEKFISFHRERASYDLTLPRIINPVALKARNTSMNYNWVADGVRSRDEKGIPGGAPVGFDLELMEWLPPRGAGKRADLILRVSGKQVGWNITKEDLAWHLRMKEKSPEEIASLYGIWDNIANISFPNPGDGILRSPKYWPYCKLKIPHRAPIEGYQPELQLEQRPEGFSLLTNYDRLKLQRNCGLYLRIRTQLDAEGRVLTANYAKILEPDIGHDSFGAIFFFNPVPNDTNLEFSYNLIPLPLDEFGKPMFYLENIGTEHR